MDEGQTTCAPECVGANGIEAATRCYPTIRSSAEWAIQMDSPVFANYGTQDTGKPFMVFGEEVILLYPVFVDTTNASYNDTFNRGYAVHDCPADACFDSETGMRFWGFVALSVLPPFTR
jgi:hypothetical protein